MAVLLSPVGGVAAQFFTNAGVPLSGGKIYTYTAGTSTPQATYTTALGTIQHSNPIVLDAAGRVPTGEIWLTDGLSYKFVLKDLNDVLIATYDNIVGINSNFVNFVNQQEIQTATAGQTVFTLTTMEYQPGTNNLSVFVDGVNQYGPGAQYAFVETDSNTVTFEAGLHVGALVKFTSTQIQNSGVADASQITYTYPDVNAVQESVEEKLAQIVSVKDFGAIGDGVTDDTTAIENALSASRSVYFPAGTYLFYPIDIVADTNITTDGFNTVFKRNPDAPSGEALLTIVGSNVSIESFTGIGDIATGSSEFNHIINILSNSTNGDIYNVSLQDINATDVRGDVVTINAYLGYETKNVSMGKIYGNNILRNVVSIVGGENITIDSITGIDVGLWVFDIEPEPTNAIVQNVNVGIIQGKAAGVVPSSATSYADNIKIGLIDVEPTIYGTNSTPPYASGGLQANGFNLRNIKTISIDQFNAKNYNSFAIKTYFNSGELGCENLTIGSIEMENCSITDSTYNAYIDTANIAHFLCDSLVVDSSATSGKTIFNYGPNLIVNNVNAVLGTNGVFIQYAANAIVNNATITGTGYFLGSNTKATVTNASFTGKVLASYCNVCTFYNVTATCSDYIFDSGHENHYVTNCTLNSSYYEDGFYLRSYTAAFRFGANWLWVDGSGKLRIKSTTAPTSDTDGTVVGTQT